MILRAARRAYRLDVPLREREGAIVQNSGSAALLLFARVLQSIIA